MLRSARLQTVAVLAAGALLGYAAASSGLHPFRRAGASPPPEGAAARPADCDGTGPACCEGANKGQLLALADTKAALAAADGKKPNILVIFGDDIGVTNLSCYSDGLMGYETPNIDRIAREGLRFLHYYGEQSCTAGRSAFLTGQHIIRTGLSKVGFPGAPMGMSQLDPSVGGLLKSLGYATGQFGKNHVGDRNETLPTVNGFD